MLRALHTLPTVCLYASLIRCLWAIVRWDRISMTAASSVPGKEYHTYSLTFYPALKKVIYNINHVFALRTCDKIAFQWCSIQYSGSWPFGIPREINLHEWGSQALFTRCDPSKTKVRRRWLRIPNFISIPCMVPRFTKLIFFLGLYYTVLPCKLPSNNRHSQHQTEEKDNQQRKCEAIKHDYPITLLFSTLLKTQTLTGSTEEEWMRSYNGNHCSLEFLFPQMQCRLLCRTAPSYCSTQVEFKDGIRTLRAWNRIKLKHNASIVQAYFLYFLERGLLPAPFMAPLRRWTSSSGLKPEASVTVPRLPIWSDTS